MTAEEIKIERAYRMAEREGMGGSAAVSVAEADEWAERMALQERFEAMKEKQRVAIRDLALRRRFGK